MARTGKFGGTTGSTLTVSITEKLIIDGRDYGGKMQITETGILDVDRRIIAVGTTEATVLTIGATPSAGVFVAANLRYLRFSNLDLTNFIILTFANENDDEFAYALEAGKSLVMCSRSEGMVDIIDAKDAALTYSLGDLKSITADADSAECDMEMYIAGV